MKQSSSSRSKQYLEKLGWIYGKTEMPWNRFTKKRKDLFGICDFIAVKDGLIMCGQDCVGNGDVAKHIKKIQENTVFPQVANAMPVYILSWAKRGARGKQKKWTVKVFNLFLDSVIETTL